MRNFSHIFFLILINNFSLLAINHQIILSKQDIIKHFDKPLKEAAKELELSESVLKKYCRKFDIHRWPYRKVKSLKNMIEVCEENKKNEIKNYLNILYKEPNTKLIDFISKPDNHRYNQKRKKFLTKKEQSKEPKLKKPKLYTTEEEEACLALISLKKDNF